MQSIIFAILNLGGVSHIHFFESSEAEPIFSSYAAEIPKTLAATEEFTTSVVKHINICAMVKSRYIGDGHPTFNRNPYNGYINPYYWVDDHPILYGNNGSLDPGTYI